MRHVAVEQVISKLRGGSASSSELEQATGVSQSSISRILRQLVHTGSVLRVGATRGARYVLRREVEGAGSRWPLRRVDSAGRIHEVGILHVLVANQYLLEPSAAAAANHFAWGGATDGLPYFLQDQRPAGFLGRAVPQRYPELALPQRVVDWNDDHYLRYLTRRGSDVIGDLILGDEAFDGYLAMVRNQTPVPSAQRRQQFPRFAEQVLQGGLPGSSAHGEHPKFTTIVQDVSGTHPVLVKFSPLKSTPAGRRWADLLIAEHRAHEILAHASLPACTSRIFELADRTYLELDRFDRESSSGRHGITSLWAIDIAHHGKLDDWISAAMRLSHEGRIALDTLEQIRLAWTFGALIANTDRHFGNLAFRDLYDGRFALAPVYDMLPMLYAPQHDQVLPRVFDPPGPSADTVKVWGYARVLAERYWAALAADHRISDEFRLISSSCAQALAAMPRTGAHAPTTPAFLRPA